MGVVNLGAYIKASKAARKWASEKGVSKVKATKALSETTREMIDNYDYRNMMGQSRAQNRAAITRGLDGLTNRLTTGNRSGRTSGGGMYTTDKGHATGSFGYYVGGGKPLLEKGGSRAVFTKQSLAKRMASNRKKGSKGGKR
jgi:hypothetical protein